MKGLRNLNYKLRLFLNRVVTFCGTDGGWGVGIGSQWGVQPWVSNGWQGLKENGGTRNGKMVQMVE